jgi:hypothetical protein
MTVDFWNSTHFENWLRGREYIDKEDINANLVYVINSIDSLTDQLPKYVRNSHIHYTAMVYAHRFIQTVIAPDSQSVLDGQQCCEIAALSLYTAIEAEGKSIPSNVWDPAVSKIFPCEVVFKGIVSAVETGKSFFIEKLNYDLHVHHPFETLLLMLGDIETADESIKHVGLTAVSIINSLYRTTAILRYPPYVIAIAAIVGGSLINENAELAKSVLLSNPVDEIAVRSILERDLFNHLRGPEIPSTEPPAIQELPSPSSRAGRSVSRHSSRSNAVTSGRSGQTTGSPNKRRPRQVVDSHSLSWALLPREDENCPPPRTSATYRRPVTLSELKILRELSNMSCPETIVKLVDVKTYTTFEEASFRNSVSGGLFVVNGLFDSSGNQFDSVVRLLGSYRDLVNVVEQLLLAVNFLSELKICHFSIEPKNIMITAGSIKIASLATCSVLPHLPSSQPSLVYRAPELLMGSTGGVKDDPLAVDLWSVGCVIAEIARIFTSRNRYEEPLFKLNDSLPDRPPLENRTPIVDPSVYTNCRYLMRIANCLNKGLLPGSDVWPNIQKRGNYDLVNQLIQFKKKRYPDRNLFVSDYSDDIKSYVQDIDDGVVLEVVRALLRWSPDRRVHSRICLGRIMKFKLN